MTPRFNTYIDYAPDKLWFIVRFWAGEPSEYFFDLLHPDNSKRQVLEPPEDLTIIQSCDGGWDELITLGEQHGGDACRARSSTLPSYST